MSYLYGALHSKAKEAISGYSITSENYKIVVEVLKKKFGDPNNIKMALNAELMNLLENLPLLVFLSLSDIGSVFLDSPNRKT